MTRPGMSDGRAFTSYVPNCEYNFNIQKTYDIKSNNEYREFLQQNASEVKQQMRTFSFSDEANYSDSFLYKDTPSK